MKIYNDLFNLTKLQIQNSGLFPNFKTLDWFNEQYTNTENEEAEAYPAIYLEIQDDVIWNQLDNTCQTADIFMRVHVVINTLDDHPVDINNAAQDVFRMLHGKAFFDVRDRQITTELVRSRTKLVKPFKALKVAIVQFETHVFDFTASPEMESVELTPNITAGISEP